MKPISAVVVAAGLSLSISGAVLAQAPQRGQAPAPNPDGPYTVTVVPPTHGKVTLTPALPADGKYAKGTVVTVTATPDPGFAIDSVFYTVPGRFGQMAHENPGPAFKV